MGILTVVLAAIIILAVIGLGWQTFFLGVKKGADKLGITSIFVNLTKEAEKSFSQIAQNASNTTINKLVTNLK